MAHYELKADTEGYADSLPRKWRMLECTLNTLSGQNLAQAIQKIDRHSRHMFIVYTMDGEDILEIHTADEWMNTVIIPGVTKVGIGKSGVEIHFAHTCGDWRVGRTVSLLEDQTVEVTCEKCRRAKGLEKIKPQHPPKEDEVVKVIVHSATTSLKNNSAFQYRELFSVRIVKNGRTVESHNFIATRSHGDDYILLSHKASGVSYTADGKVIWKDGELQSDVHLKPGFNKRQYFRELFGHTE